MGEVARKHGLQESAENQLGAAVHVCLLKLFTATNTIGRTVGPDVKTR